MSTNIRIPSDIDRHDRLIGPFTARHLAILAGTALVFSVVWALTRAVVSPIVILAVAAPVGSLVAVLLLTTRDGLSADRLLAAAIRFRLCPRHWVRVPRGMREAPQWLTARARRSGKTPVVRPLTAQGLRLPESVTAGGGGARVGIVDMGPDGLVAVAAAGTINLGLRTPQEQDSLVAQLGSWLHALRQPVHIVVRTVRLDLSTQIGRLRTAAEHMSDELAATAVDHAEHLGNMAANEILLHRHVLLVWREPVATLATISKGLNSPSPLQILANSISRRRTPEPSEAAQRAAETRLVRHIEEATELLALGSNSHRARQISGQSCFRAGVHTGKPRPAQRTSRLAR